MADIYSIFPFKPQRLYLCLFIVLLSVSNCFAQTVKAPDEDRLFEKDNKKIQKFIRDREKSALNVEASASKNLDFKAPNVEFLKEKNRIANLF